jgi:hypothetical protein
MCAAIALTCLALAGAADALVRHERGPTGDEPFYILMATHPGRAHSFPYADRILVPWLVHALPFALATSFTLLAALCIAAAGAVLYVLLRTFTVPVATAAGLAIGLAISPDLLVVMLRDGRSVDPATTLVMILGCLLIVRRRRLALAVTLVLGVAVKETSLFLVPLTYAVWARRMIDREALRDTLLVAAAPVAAYLVIRLAVPAVGSSYTVAKGSFITSRVDNLRQALTLTSLRRAAYTFGPLWLVAPFALRDLWFARRGMVLVLLCVAALTVSFDTGRVIFLAAPVFYVAAGWVIRRRARAAALTIVCLLAVDVGYGVYMQVDGVRNGLDTTAPAPIQLR